MNTVTWIKDDDVRWLGQTPPAPQAPSSQARTLTVLEKATIASVIISGIGVAVSLWQILSSKGETS